MRRTTDTLAGWHRRRAVTGAPPRCLAPAPWNWRTPVVDSARRPPIGLRAMSAIVVVTTVGGEEEANLIARELVARRHAACVNIIRGVRSVYRWKGKICQDGEYMLIIKTLKREYELVAAAIGELHSYELPEILSFEIGQGDDRFLAWIQASLDKTAEFLDDEEDGMLDLVDQDG